MGRRSKLQEIEKEYSHLLGEEWRSIHSWSCYHCVRKYYRLYCNRELRDFTKLDQIYAFTDNAIDTEEGEYVMKSEMFKIFTWYMHRQIYNVRIDLHLCYMDLC